jgi:anti-sigma regulatory factor (Ser/Thr protein kinase)
MTCLRQGTFRQEAQPVPLTSLETMDSQREVRSVPFEEVVVPSDPAEARCVQDQIEQLLQDHRVNDHDVFSIKLALEEALINAIKHGNQLDRNKKVHVTFRVLQDRFEVRIRDEGPGFDPADVPDPILKCRIQ